MMDSVIKVTKLTTASELFKFSIDSPKERIVNIDVRDFVKLKGWIFDTNGDVPHLVLDCDLSAKFTASVDRPDVVQVYKSAPEVCGFETLIEAGVNVRIGAMHGDEVVWFASISFEVVNVLIGSGGYLFLDNDSNKSVSQYSGDTLIDSLNLQQWEKYFARISSEQLAGRFSSAFLIAPAKEYIFPDLYPVVRKGATPFDQFISLFNKKASIINPLDRLILERGYSYSRVDTHWTHYGAHLAAEMVCQHFGHPFVDPDYNYKFTPTAGDLGVKLSPIIKESIPQPDFSILNGKRIFDNKILNRGRVHVYQNHESNNEKTCIVFGDSFSTTLIIHLIASFRRLVHVFSGADIDWAIVRNEQPDFLLAEMTTRFFIKAPSAEFSLKNELWRKISAFNPSQRKAAVANLERFTDPSVDYYKSISMAALNKLS